MLLSSDGDGDDGDDDDSDGDGDDGVGGDDDNHTIDNCDDDYGLLVIYIVDLTKYLVVISIQLGLILYLLRWQICLQILKKLLKIKTFIESSWNWKE